MKIITLRKYCSNPECSGEFVCSGSSMTYDTYPSSTFWYHQCKFCGKKDSFDKKYPHTFNEYNEDEKEERWEE